MIDLNRLGNNIRCLRIAHGETQEQLGSHIYDLSRQAICQYESGKHEPNKVFLAAIAEHYGVPVDELLSGDFSKISKINYNSESLSRMTDGILFTEFPIIASEKALANQHFQKAHQHHQKFFSSLQNQTAHYFSTHKFSNSGFDEAFDEFKPAIDEYYLAGEEDATLSEEVEANLWGMMLFCKAFYSQRFIFEKKPVWLTQILSHDKKLEIALEEERSSEEEKIENSQITSDPEMDEPLSEIKITLKKSSSFGELADYYLALEYCLNITDSGLGPIVNARIGYEMMKTFFSVGNPYAKDYLFLMSSKDKEH